MLQRYFIVKWLLKPACDHVSQLLDLVLQIHIYLVTHVYHVQRLLLVMFGRLSDFTGRNPSGLFNCLTFNKKIICRLNDTWHIGPHTQGSYLAGYSWESVFKNPVLWSAPPLCICRKPGQSVSHGTGVWRKEWVLWKFSCKLPAVSPLFCSDLHKHTVLILILSWGPANLYSFWGDCDAGRYPEIQTKA